MANIPTQRLRRTIWWSALYDLLVTLLFATPWTAQLVIGLFASLHTGLDLPGQFPAFAPLHLFFVNLFGTIVVLWAVVRLRDPQPHFGLIDSAGRFLFSVWMTTYLLGYGSSALLVAFLIPEVVWCVVQLRAWRLHAHPQNANQPAPLKSPRT